ncbi:MAG: glycosyltransferase family 2 protein, partial [Gammaproteobacteria bacterium]|nr:glycosyltransferase family 2 protein [Gammaproteobacteria bacterium]
LAQQSESVREVLIVDNRSKDRETLKRELLNSGLKGRVVELDYNLGYAGGANVGTQLVDPASQYVLYVGPDTYLTKDYVKIALRYLSEEQNKLVAAVSGKLLGYDNELQKSTGLIDSTGVCQTWYGRWYDRWQGKKERPATDHLSPDVLALCGTALFCRREALTKLEGISPFSVYDASFFMYKEDIDLSIRLRLAGFVLRYNPNMIAYHCRGWSRSKMSQRAKILSARNEAQLNARRGLVKYLFSCLKLYVVSR